MQDWARNDVLSIIALPLFMVGTVAAVVMVPYPRFRHTLLTLVLLIIIADVGIVVWVARRQPVEISKVTRRPDPTPQVKPSPSPSPPAQRPTPEATPPPAQAQTDSARAIPFHISSMSDQSIRQNYCVVGDFDGECRLNAKSIDVTLTEANINLCNYSSHGPRSVSIKVGVGDYNAIARGGPRMVNWSQTVTINKRINPGEMFNLSDPLHFAIPKRHSKDLSKYGLIIQVSNITFDTNKENRYCLYSERGLFSDGG